MSKSSQELTKKVEDLKYKPIGEKNDKQWIWNEKYAPIR